MSSSPLAVSKLKVAQLKAELAKRNLPTTGLKAVLADRLLLAIQQESQPPQQEEEESSSQHDKKRPRTPSDSPPIRPSKVPNQSLPPSQLDEQRPSQPQIPPALPSATSSHHHQPIIPPKNEASDQGTAPDPHVDIVLPIPPPLVHANNLAPDQEKVEPESSIPAHPAAATDPAPAIQSSHMLADPTPLSSQLTSCSTPPKKALNNVAPVSDDMSPEKLPSPHVALEDEMPVPSSQPPANISHEKHVATHVASLPDQDTTAKPFPSSSSVLVSQDALPSTNKVQEEDVADGAPDHVIVEKPPNSPKSASQPLEPQIVQADLGVSEAPLTDHEKSLPPLQPRSEVGDEVQPADASKATLDNPSEDMSGPNPDASANNHSEKTEPGKDQPIDPTQPPPTRSLYISNLVRPLTVNQLRKKLSEFGETSYFWIDPIRSHAYVTFQEESAALATYTSLHQTTPWPPETGKMLRLVFVPEKEVSRLVAEEEESLKTHSSRGRLALTILQQEEDGGWRFELRPMMSSGSRVTQQPRGLASSTPVSQLTLVSASLDPSSRPHLPPQTNGHSSLPPTHPAEPPLPDLHFDPPLDLPKGGPEKWFKKTLTTPHLFYLPYLP